MKQMINDQMENLLKVFQLEVQDSLKKMVKSANRVIEFNTPTGPKKLHRISEIPGELNVSLDNLLFLMELKLVRYYKVGDIVLVNLNEINEDVADLEAKDAEFEIH